MVSNRLLRRLAFVAAIGALMLATSQANTPAPRFPQFAPYVEAAEAAPPVRPVRVKKAAVAETAFCAKARVQLFIEGEGWLIRSVSRCA